MSSKTFIVMVAALFLFVSAAIEAGAQGRIGPPDDIRRMIEDKARERDLGGMSSLGFTEITSSTTGTHVWAGYYERGIVYVVPRYGVVVLTSAAASVYYNQFNASV